MNVEGTTRRVSPGPDRRGTTAGVGLEERGGGVAAGRVGGRARGGEEGLQIIIRPAERGSN